MPLSVDDVAEDVVFVAGFCLLVGVGVVVDEAMLSGYCFDWWFALILTFYEILEASFFLLVVDSRQDHLGDGGGRGVGKFGLFGAGAGLIRHLRIMLMADLILKARFGALLTLRPLTALDSLVHVAWI